MRGANSPSAHKPTTRPSSRTTPQETADSRQYARRARIEGTHTQAHPAVRPTTLPLHAPSQNAFAAHPHCHGAQPGASGGVVGGNASGYHAAISLCGIGKHRR